MIRKWATVITWKNGIAQLRCSQSTGCGSCHSNQTCGIHIFNKMATRIQNSHLEVIYALPLVPGQRVEVGLKEGRLLRSAFLVYMLPLLGLIGGAATMLYTLDTDLASAYGGLVGGVVGFLYARYLAGHMYHIYNNQLVILQAPPSSISLYLLD